MSTWDDPEFDQSGQQQGNGPADLRKALEKAQKAAKEAAEAATKAQSENRTLRIGSYLTKHGVNPDRFAQHVPGDLEPTEENVQKWIESSKDVFNFGTAEAAPSGKAETASSTAPVAPPAGEQAAAAESTANPLAGIDPQLIDALAKLGVIGSASTAASGAETVRLEQQIQAASPKSLADAKDILAGMGIEFQDTSGYKF